MSAVLGIYTGPSSSFLGGPWLSPRDASILCGWMVPEELPSLPDREINLIDACTNDRRAASHLSSY